MRWIAGKLTNERILVRVGIRSFLPYESVGAITSPISLDYRPYTALVDTGATRTCLTERVVQDLGLRRRGRVEVWNIKRPELHWTYLFHIGIWPDQIDETPQPIFGIGDEIEGIDVGNNRFFDVLLGMDVIRQGALSIEPNGNFRIGF